MSLKDERDKIIKYLEIEIVRMKELYKTNVNILQEQNKKLETENCNLRIEYERINEKRFMEVKNMRKYH